MSGGAAVRCAGAPLRLYACLLLLGAPLAAQAPPSPPRSDSVARLWAPNMLQQRAPTTARDDDSLVQALEHKIRCTCGCNLDVFTCRTTDFTCTTSPAMHRLVLARLDSGKTPDQVIASFVAQYGESVLMEPPKHGFNWMAYIMPFAGLAVGLGIVGALMRRWVRSAPGRQVAPPEPPPVEASSEDLERLKRELEKFGD
jgi:cytochrome c-type biogenesis protein CcmH